MELVTAIKKTMGTLTICILLSGPLNGQDWTITGNSLTTVGKLGSTNSQNLNIITNNKSRIYIKKTGEIGMGGITTPAGKLNISNLDLTSITGNGGFQIGTSDAKNLVMDNDEIQARNNGVASSLLLNYHNSSDIKMCFGNSVQRGGAVAIGKALNYGRLNISGDNSSAAAQTIASFGTDGPGISIVRNWPGIYYNAYWDTVSSSKKSMAAGYGSILEMDPATGNLFYNTTNVATGAGQTMTPVLRMTITNAGKMGIGTTSFNNMLHVREGASGLTGYGQATGVFEANHENYINILSPSGLQSGILFGTNGSNVHGGIIYNDGSTVSGLQFRTNGNLTRMVVTNSGNIGVGTLSPAYKLDVCGTIRSKEVRVETGWCDYVFADNYKLRPLEEVESFIKENKHLPDVTKGSIIETEGLEIGKVSSQMIRKIEELTLYVIELQKQVDALKNAK